MAATRSIEWLVRSRRAHAHGGANFIIARDGRIAAIYLFLDKRWSSDVRLPKGSRSPRERGGYSFSNSASVRDRATTIEGLFLRRKIAGFDHTLITRGPSVGVYR